MAPHPPSSRSLPARPARRLVPILPDPKSKMTGRPGESAHDPDRFWWNYYQKHDESLTQLKQTVVMLNQAKKFRDVQAVLSAYLTLRNKTPSLGCTKPSRWP